MTRQKKKGRRQTADSMGQKKKTKSEFKSREISARGFTRMQRDRLAQSPLQLIQREIRKHNATWNRPFKV